MSYSLVLIIGIIGQALFSARFIIQIIHSEKKKESVIPLHFWYFSLLGGITLFIYAVLRKDPVFMIGQSIGIFIYSRNLYFIKTKENTNANE